MARADAITVNGRTYRVPDRPVVVICADGCDPRYLDHALAAGVMPTLARWRTCGTHRLARAAMPTFTNPNNVSLVTGVSAAVHGICGNYFYDPAADREVMMDDPRFLCAETIPAALARTGVPTAVVTAKDKLRRLLGHGLNGICFSAEKAGGATRRENGIEGVADLVGLPFPQVYSAALSAYVLAAGLALLRRRLARVLYLSLSDYVQHKYAPGTAEANDFCALLDRFLDEFERAGAVVGLTADHGMNAKVRPDGTPNIVYLRPVLQAIAGPGSGRVVLPITDPYVLHHGALGSFATVYVFRPAQRDLLIERLVCLPGIAGVYDRAAAAAKFELPADRIGDVIVLADEDTVLGKSPPEHDLSLLDRPLRSHGGLAEQTVPFVLSTPREGLRPDLRNFDVFDCVLNG
jgi:phosphonoacetate hydrolase